MKLRNRVLLATTGPVLVLATGIPIAAASKSQGIPLSPKHSVVASRDATAFALGGGRLAWRTAPDARGRSRIIVATVHGNRITHRHTVGVARGGAALGVSASTVAYATRAHGVRGLQVVTARTSSFIAPVSDRRIDVSGHKVLYFVRAGTGTLHARVFEAYSRRTLMFKPTLRRSVDGMPASLSGHRVAYELPTGAVRVYDMATGHSTLVRPAGGNASTPRVFLSGNTVSWGFHTQAQYRDLATMSAPGSIDLDAGGTMVDLSDHGVIMVSDYTSTTKSYWLVPVGSTGGPDFVRTSSGVPVIDGSTIAWRDQKQELRIAPSAQLSS